jgi:hypothetical protein
MPRSALLGTGERVGAHEDRRRAGLTFDRIDNLPLRTPHISDQHIGRRGPGGAKNVFGNTIYGCAYNYEISFGNAGVEVSRAAIDGAASGGLIQRALITTNANDMGRDPPRADRQADGATDQADTDDGYRSETLQVGFLDLAWL